MNLVKEATERMELVDQQEVAVEAQPQKEKAPEIFRPLSAFWRAFMSIGRPK
jgi:hypothetical protein